MAHGKNTVITARQIRAMRPNECIEVSGVDNKRRSIISSMINYVKDRGLPRYIGHIFCTCRGGSCKIVALPKGKTKKEWIREQLVLEES